MNEQPIRLIEFPNTVPDHENATYAAKDGYTFRYLMKAGEMSGIAWIEVSKDGVKVAEIKESVCNIYF